MDDNSKNISVQVELPHSLDNAISNLTNNATVSIGNTLSDIWFLVFGHLSHMAEKRREKYNANLEAYKAALHSSIEKIPSDKLIEPNIQITAQALEHSKYCIEEKALRDMFVSLISSSMNSDFEQDIHPSFAEILKQMSSFDAVMLKRLKDFKIMPCAIGSYILKAKTGHITLREHIFLGCSQDDLSNASLSISSLSRLGLIETSYSLYLTEEEVYVPFKKTNVFKSLQQKYSPDVIDLQKGILSITPLGMSFIKVCIPD